MSRADEVLRSLDAKPTRPTTRKKSEPAEVLDFDSVAAEAAKLADGPFGYLLWLDAKLVAAGFPAMSPWWKSQIAAFYKSGKRFGVFLVGRGGGKSTTLTRVAVAEALFADRTIPPGQRWIWPFLSVSSEDSRRRIVEIAAILRAIGVDAAPKFPLGRATIEIDDAIGNPIAFIALAATISGVSGPTTIGGTIDEEAKLLDGSRSVNPAGEILASLVQTFRARPGVRAIRCSSAWTSDGSHAAAIREGDTLMNHVGRLGDFLPAALEGFRRVAGWERVRHNARAADQIEAHAASLTANTPAVPTWIANPSIGAVASREEVEALSPGALGGWTRSEHWLRECGSAVRDAGRGAASCGTAVLCGPAKPFYGLRDDSGAGLEGLEEGVEEDGVELLLRDWDRV